ncbi:MAG: RNA methyltransferase [Crenarchaeota archaeon]|nr:RNA methyltransferase [Thermoproteota archaeon]MDW8033812.1 RNA methyltransferase [Nitrososphaerota archaeon]
MQISIALPASVIGITDDLRVKTFRAGLVGRAAAIFMVDEIIIYLDDYSKESLSNQRVFSKLLEYMVVPQYLRKIVFKKEEELRFAGLLPPLKIPSHTVPSSLKQLPPKSFRLAAVVGKSDKKIVLEAGLEKRLIAPIPEPSLKANPGDVVLIMVEDPTRLKASIVDPSNPPFYLGYHVSSPRATLGALLKKADGVKIGTSKYGELFWKRIKELKRLIAKTSRAMIVFGSPSMGIREILARENILVDEVFDIVVNTVGEQGTETVRTEEAIYITLPLLTSLIRSYLEV